MLEKWINDKRENKIISDERIEAYAEEIVTIDYSSDKDHILSKINDKLKRLLDDIIIKDCIQQTDKTLEAEEKRAIAYELSGKMSPYLEAIREFYLPPAELKFTKYERLAVPAIVGSILLGILFYLLLGHFFVEQLYAPLMGMPLGAGLFVWLFSKSISHPKISKIIKWAAVVGFAGLTVGMVYSSVKGGLFGKARINFFQWLWLALLTLLVFWMLHIFKPVKVQNTLEIKRSLKRQVIVYLRFLINKLIEDLDQIVNHRADQPVDTGMEKADIKLPRKMLDQSDFSRILEQLNYAVESKSEQMALNSAQSLMNSLAARGINRYKDDNTFVFSREDARFYDTFGLIKEGDKVEKLLSTWVDSDGCILAKGKVRKVK